MTVRPKLTDDQLRHRIVGCVVFHPGGHAAEWAHANEKHYDMAWDASACTDDKRYVEIHPVDGHSWNALWDRLDVDDIDYAAMAERTG